MPLFHVKSGWQINSAITTYTVHCGTILGKRPNQRHGLNESFQNLYSKYIGRLPCEKLKVKHILYNKYCCTWCLQSNKLLIWLLRAWYFMGLSFYTRRVLLFYKKCLTLLQELFNFANIARRSVLLCYKKCLALLEEVFFL